MTQQVALPRQIEQALERGAALAVSISAGKDSQAMLSAVCRLHRERAFSGPIFAVHADLGRIEWVGTLEHARKIAADNDVELHIVRRTDGRDMLDHWTARGERLESQGKRARPWSDASNRFCTSDMKRDPIDSLLRSLGHAVVISAEGLRAEESPARAKKPVAKLRSRICTSFRTAWTWNPILHWSLDDVLKECGSSMADLARRQVLYLAGRQAEALDGWQLHYVYVYGNRRLSCSFCVLGCESDLANAARHNPETLTALVAIEDRWGFTFQQGKSLRRFLPIMGQAV